MTMRRAAIVAPLRTPVGTFGRSLRTVAAEDLAASVIKAVLERTGIDPELIDDVACAQSYANSEAPCIGRWAALHAGLPVSVPGFQIDRRGRRGAGRRRGIHEQHRALHHLGPLGRPVREPVPL